MRQQDYVRAYRHVYQPRPDRLPRWLWRLWVWF
jgi:hypothetical protein